MLHFFSILTKKVIILISRQKTYTVSNPGLCWSWAGDWKILCKCKLDMWEEERALEPEVNICQAPTKQSIHSRVPRKHVSCQAAEESPIVRVVKNESEFPWLLRWPLPFCLVLGSHKARARKAGHRAARCWWAVLRKSKFCPVTE